MNENILMNEILDIHLIKRFSKILSRSKVNQYLIFTTATVSIYTLVLMAADRCVQQIVDICLFCIVVASSY